MSDSPTTHRAGDPSLALEKRNRELRALHQAALAIAAELSLDKVLQQIVDSAREVVAAQYAALGVFDAHGVLQEFIHSGMSLEQVARIPHLPRGEGLLGAIVQEERPIRVEEIAEDPRSTGFPPAHPPMNSFLGVPIKAGAEVLGNLYLTNKLGADAFSGEDEDLVRMLAAHAAVAIQNARLYEQVGRLAIVEERSRIGMDLHDGIIQSIYAVGLTLESARLVLRDEPEQADELLERALYEMNETIRDIRNFILDLRPRQFQGDLREGLARLVREFQANTAVEATLAVAEGGLDELPPMIARTFFLTTQEALANVARHARADQVWIALGQTDHSVTLSIRDNGRGFEAGALQRTVGHGLSNMRTRARDLGGRFVIDSMPGAGTTVRLTLPLTHD
ncbi:MAG: GAF domain-containing sensor histidine kinase [Candidatus Promineifilaceae bacterium]|nr:GAF domain-containing sensor histidine kinase [Candidatus Promineifilaceae bacterium]